MTNQGTLTLVCFADRYPVRNYCMLNPKTLKICLTKDMTFSGKSYSDLNKVKKPASVPMSYEGSDDEKVERVLSNNENNNNHIMLKRILRVMIKQKKSCLDNKMKKK